MAVDKFLYHLPLYRQHKRMELSGILLARANLTNWMHRAAVLLEPVYAAVLASVLDSLVLALDLG
jgi:transposase